MSLLQLPTNPTFSVSPTCQSFTGGMGTQIENRDAFMSALTEAMAEYDTSNDRAEGQHFIHMDPSVISDAGISCGVGRASQDPSAYHLVNWRGRVGAYLKREHAATPESVAVAVYSASAWANDPDVIKAELPACEGDYCIVGVFANAAGTPNAYGSHRLVANLAGGNEEAKHWTADEIREKAAASIEYESGWSVVCD